MATDAERAQQAQRAATTSETYGTGTGTTSGGATATPQASTVAARQESEQERRAKYKGVWLGLDKLQSVLAMVRKLSQKFAMAATVVCAAGVLIGAILSFLISPAFVVMPAAALIFSLLLFWAISYVENIMVFVDVALELLHWHPSQSTRPSDAALTSFRRAFGKKSELKLEQLIAYDVNHENVTVEQRVRQLVMQILESSVINSIRSLARFPALGAAIAAIACYVAAMFITAYWPEPTPPEFLARPSVALNGEGGVLSTVANVAVKVALHTPVVGTAASVAAKVIDAAVEGNLKARSFIEPKMLEHYAMYLGGIALALLAAAELAVRALSATLRAFLQVRKDEVKSE